MVLTAAAVLAGACSGAQRSAQGVPRVERSAREYFPLRVNAAWSFDSVDMDHPGETGLVTMRVVRGDESGFEVNQGRGPTAHYEYEGAGVTRNGEVFLNGPVREGLRWQGLSGDSYVIAHAGLTRTVPAGTFHDVIEVVRTDARATLTNGTQYRETYWYAPNVGPIEAIVPVLVGSGDVRRFRLTLRGYTLDGEL